MRNKIIYFILFNLTFTLSAQQIVDAFINMPGEYYLSLSSAQRKDLVREYNMITKYNTDTIATETGTNNIFKGKSSITAIDTTKQFLSVQNSENGKVFLKILPSDLSNTVFYYVLIFTACAPVCDSHIGFYDTNWTFIRGAFMPKVKITDFLDTDKIEADNKKTAAVAEQFDIVFIELRFIDNGNNIEAVLNSGQYLDEKNYDKLKKYLKGDKILFKWENDSFKMDTCYW